MSNETKRDVFNDLLEDLAVASVALDGEGIGEEFTDGDKQFYLDEYDAALPDDLPVIPKAVGEYIKWGKAFDIPMYMMFSFKFVRSQGFSKLTDEVEDWIINNSDAFAIAWLLGVWRVEETGEIVKLEAQHD